MRSQTIANKLFDWRLASVVIVPAALTACWGTTTPSSEPTKNPLDDAPPAEMPPAASSPDEVTTKKNKFDEEQAKVVLARAEKSAHTCVDVVDKDQPHGDATVTVTFAGSGKSTKATIPPPYDGTPIGQCATRAFVNIIVPPFEGPDVDMPYQVDLKADGKGATKKEKKK
jgi:hypothetical protein